jgi:hypothetical protein
MTRVERTGRRWVVFKGNEPILGTSGSNLRLSQNESRGVIYGDSLVFAGIHAMRMGIAKELLTYWRLPQNTPEKLRDLIKRLDDEQSEEKT